MFMGNCSRSPLAGTKSGSETTNGRVSGTIVNSNGTLESNVIVRFLPSSYDPFTKNDSTAVKYDTSDAFGNFAFDSVDTGSFTIEAVHSKMHTRAMIPAITVNNDTISLPLCTLAVPGAISIDVPDNADPVNGYVYIPGTSIYKFFAGSLVPLVLDSIPAGVIPSVIYSASNSSYSATLRNKVIVKSGDTAELHNPSWKYARRLRLNTTSSGADIAGNVANFPLLLRLTPANFTFNQTLSGGADIRFTKSDNTFIKYEIKRWDATHSYAEIWVKVDTVRGNDSMQSITMYWGNPDAASESDGAAVFDSASGFEGAWHLNETSGTLARDASHNGFTGTYMGGLPRVESGPLGICQNITRPDTDYIDIGNVLNPGMKNFAIGVWLKRATFGTQQAIIAKTNGNGPSAAYGYLLNFDNNDIPHLYMATGNTAWGGDSTFDVKANVTISDSTTWHYVSVTIDRSDSALCKMYVDGIDKTGVKSGNVTKVSALSNALDLHIGTESDNNCSYSGAIGEVTIAFTTRSADWVKLCYMNQKERDALVKW
jgi:hypothetical protein